MILVLLMVFCRIPRHGYRPPRTDDRPAFCRFSGLCHRHLVQLPGPVNVGAASGMLPTKGLTLPLISYGGSSLVIMTTAIALLLRIDFETRGKSPGILRRAR